MKNSLGILLPLIAIIHMVLAQGQDQQGIRMHPCVSLLLLLQTFYSFYIDTFFFFVKVYRYILLQTFWFSEVHCFIG